MGPHIRSMMGENHLSVREPANPRVLALHYRVVNNHDVIYRTAERSVHRRDELDVVMDAGRVVFEFHDHYPSEESARAGVRDFIDEWKFQADLAIGARKFRLEFVRAEIVDRHLVLGDRHAPSWVTLASMRLPAIPHPVDYPRPPERMTIDPEDVLFVAMRQRYEVYSRDPTTLMTARGVFLPDLS